MSCDYYTQSELVIEFIDEKGCMCKTKTNRLLKKGYVFNIPNKDSDDYKKYIEKMIDKNTYKKVLYENETWVKKLYENRYLQELKMICPRMVKLIKMYKDYIAWERN